MGVGSEKESVCVILGGGGHARVLIDSVQMSEAAKIRGVLDSERALWGKELLGVPILGGDDLISDLVKEGVNLFVVGVGSVGKSDIRRRLYALGLDHGLTPLTVCHPSAVRSASAQIGAGSVLYPTAVVNAGVVLGVNVIVNTGAIVEHDCIIGDHVHIATGARLSGAVRVGNDAHVGVGATVRQGLSIGEGAIVGAGAVVVKNVEPWTVVVGVPARVMKRRKADVPLGFSEPKKRLV